MSTELDSEMHLAGCCCLECVGGTSETGDAQWSAGDIDPDQPVEQNAGSTSFPVSTVSGDGIQIGDAVLSGLKWDTTELTFSFPDSMSDYEYSRNGTFQAFNDAQKSAALYAFDLIEQYTTVRFTMVTGWQDGDADIRLAEESSAPTAYAYYPSGSVTGGDAWFNSNSYNSPVLGNYAFTTIMHEIGHAMGLKHAHETSFAGALPYYYDSHEYSLMTYRSYVGSTALSYTDAPDSAPQSFMMADIAALQIMYGANFGTQSGNTTYSFDQTTGQMSIDGVGQLDAGGETIFRTVWDGNGVDTYDLSNFTTDLAVDLRPGEGTDLDVGGVQFRADLGPNTSDTFNNGYARKHLYNALLYNGDERSLIENANGGSGSDSFIGNDADNVLNGMGGNDRFTDSAGSDTYLGGAGSDEVVFGGLFSSYSFTVGAQFLEVAGNFVDYVWDTVETLTFSDRSWDYAALAGNLVPSNPDAIPDSFSVQESDAAGLAAIGSLLANDTDQDGLSLSVIEINGQSAAVGSIVMLASGASLMVAADGTVSYGQNGRFAALDAGESATDSFTYKITNGTTTDTATVVITVHGVDDPNIAPAAVADAFRGSEGAAIGGNVLANDGDANGDSFQVSKVNGGSLNATLGSGASVTMSSNGIFTYQQNGAFNHLELGQSATDSFAYTIIDEHGATATATVTITIDGIADPNAAPKPAADAFRGLEATLIGGNVLANDHDPDGDAFQVTKVNGGPLDATLASGATVSMNADGTFAYHQNGAFAHLDAGQIATDHFSYTITDEHGAVSTASVTITIDGVPEPNADPVAVDDTFRGAEGASIGGDVLANDSDPDGDGLSVSAIDGGALNETLDSGATVSMSAGGVFTYRQNGAFEHLGPGETATDSFSYTITDERGATSTATVWITIDGVRHDAVLTDLLPRPGDLTGSAGNDYIRGDHGSQAIFGFAGDDRLDAKHGSDILSGGAGSDWLRSDKHNPTIHYFGTEQRNGVVEIDTIENFRVGIDSINLGGGAVASVVEDRHTLITLEGDGDQILLRWVNDYQAVSFVDSVPNRASDPTNRDLLPGWGDITGSGGSETLQGTDASERIFGLGGGDWIFGGGGNDVLVGGSGNDKLYGGLGSDTFVFQREARNDNQHFSAILDYDSGDRIRLIETSVEAWEVRHNGIILDLTGDGDNVFVKHVFDIDDLAFV